MQQPNSRSERILGLIDGYPELFGGNGEVMNSVARQQWVRKTMDESPGRWFVVGEVRHVNRRRVSVGPHPYILRGYGYEVEIANSKVYARAPHPSGRPLSDYVDIAPPKRPSDAPPELTSDKFGWSGSEIQDALATARAWLFPIEGIAA